MSVQFSPLVHQVVGCAIEVHKALGPGLLESSYALCLTYELSEQKINFATQVPVPIHYKTLKVDCAYRADVVVAGALLLELKSCDALLPIHRAQVITYLKLLRLPQGLILNFNAPRLVDGLMSILA